MGLVDIDRDGGDVDMPPATKVNTTTGIVRRQDVSQRSSWEGRAAMCLHTEVDRCAWHGAVVLKEMSAPYMVLAARHVGANSCSTWCSTCLKMTASEAEVGFADPHQLLNFVNNQWADPPTKHTREALEETGKSTV